MRALLRFFKNTDAAVAPTIALSLTGLIAGGAIAFDYARMASMDTELQSAADQAALAAASQLDGLDGARDRATTAAQNLVSNLTYFANDGGGQAVTVPTVVFYADYDPATGDKRPVATGDDDANYVLVTVGARQAVYALTPVVALFNSGNMTASAFATMDSAYCNFPPFMLCKPTPDFNAADHIGKGLRLVIGAPSAPGNFGFLQTGFGSGAEALAKAIGWNGSAGGCVAARGVMTEPGNKQSVRSSFNTRFDLSEQGQGCVAGGTCSPSTNVRKDLVHGSSCGTTGQQGWEETPVPYRARNLNPLSPANPMIDNGPAGPSPTDVAYPDNMGYPRDYCHAVSNDGTCTYDPGHIVGTGNWDRDAFFSVNYGWDHATWTAALGLGETPTRYQVYTWENANPTPAGTAFGGIGRPRSYTIGPRTKTTNGTPVCRPPGFGPTNPDTDRRRMAAAVVDCSALGGRGTGPLLDWMEVFLVEPTFPRGTGANARTGDGDIYVEVIGTKPIPGINQTVGNIVRRDVPRLIE